MDETQRDAPIGDEEAQKQLESLAQILLKRNWKATAAESCTAGMVSAKLTRLPGSSAWFDMGISVYSNEAKARLLAVGQDILSQYGAVSEQTAIAMCWGVMGMAKADVAVSVTGVAGPSGGSPGKPVGTVWFAAGTRRGVFAKKKVFPGDRDAVREAAARFAVAMLLEAAQRRE